MCWSHLWKAVLVAALACCAFGPYPVMHEETRQMTHYFSHVLKQLNPLRMTMTGGR